MGPFAEYLQTAPYLHTETWRDWLHASIDHLGYAAFWVAALQIVFINLLLSGDNAVIIAMACRGLPAQQRRWGIVLGAGVAVILRIVFVGIIARADAAALFQARRRCGLGAHRGKTDRARAPTGTTSGRPRIYGARS